MKIYVVASGLGEDYGINKIFLSKEAAENYCNYWNMFENDEDEHMIMEEYDDYSHNTANVFYKYARVILYNDDSIRIDPAIKPKETEVTGTKYWYSINFTIDITSCNSREDIEKLARETVESKYPHWKEGKI